MDSSLIHKQIQSLYLKNICDIFSTNKVTYLSPEKIVEKLCTCVNNERHNVHKGNKSCNVQDILFYTMIFLMYMYLYSKLNKERAELDELVVNIKSRITL